MTPREEWMLMANMTIPVVATSSEDARDHSQYSLDLAKNIDLTRRALTMGIALSALDGPLPVMDVVAFVGVSVYTTVLWSQFYLEYHH
jgi:hypothetical protein